MALGGGGHTTGVHTLINTKAKDEYSAKVLIFYRNGKIRTASSTQNYYVQGAASSAATSRIAKAKGGFLHSDFPCSPSHPCYQKH